MPPPFFYLSLILLVVLLSILFDLPLSRQALDLLRLLRLSMPLFT